LICRFLKKFCCFPKILGHARPVSVGHTEINSSCDTVRYIQLARGNRVFEGQLNASLLNKNGMLLPVVWLSYGQKQTAIFTLVFKTGPATSRALSWPKYQQSGMV
jgi:hypothetical protein